MERDGNIHFVSFYIFVIFRVRLIKRKNWPGLSSVGSLHIITLDSSVFHNLLKSVWSQKPEDLREMEPDQSLDLSQASSFREEIISSNAEEEDSDVDEEAERISSEMEATNQCHFCDYRAPVP